MNNAIPFHLIGSAASTLLSIALVASPPPAAKATGLLTGAASIGYGAATLALSRPLRRQGERMADERDRHRHQVEIEKSKLSRAQREAQIEAAKSTEARQQLIAARAQLEPQIRAQIEREFNALRLALVNDCAVKIQDADRQRCDGIKAAKSKHRQREQFLHGEIERLRESLDQRDAQLKEEFDRAISQYEGLYEELDKALAAYGGEVETARGSFQATYEAKVQEIERLHRELATYRNPAPFRGTDKASLVGNRLLDFFMARGIVLDAEKCESKLDRSLVWVRPRGTTIEGIKDHLESLQLAFELVAKPDPKIDNGCILFNLQDAVIEVPTEIPEPSPERLIDALKRSNHVRINAPTDSGKSTLLDNILSAYALIHEGEMGLTLLDPKYPFTPWNNHQPDFKGFAECLGAVTNLSRLIDERLKEARALADAGQPLPSHQPHLFAIDELEALHDDAIAADDNKKGDNTKDLERAIRTGLKVGRGLTAEKGKGIKVLYCTQSPLCSRIGLNRDDFDQSTNIYLGSNIPLVLQDGGELSGKVPDSKRRQLSREYEARLAAGHKYVMLVRLPNGGDCFLMKAPRPGYFADQAADLGYSVGTGHQAAEKAIECPQCGSHDVVKNGRGTKGRTRRVCKGCGKRFQA